MLNIPHYVEKVLELDEQVKRLSLIYTCAHNFLYLGRGYGYPVALEGTLKLKEISYSHMPKGYPAVVVFDGKVGFFPEKVEE